uniref:Uncharacterized protein n=1 Tax=Romanomermis culicivorax TaxID=13658 RepID=A0A915K1X0_ROMCU
FERPRFYAEELGVKEKLLIAVISDHINLNLTPFAAAVNRTVANYAKIAYMSFDHSTVNNFLQKSNQSMSLVFSHPKTVHFFAQLINLFQKYARKYDWIFLIDDVTYVKSFRLLEFVSHLWTPNYDVVLGNISQKNEGSLNATICSLAAGGLLISTSAASKISRRLLTDCKIDEKSADFHDGHFAECLQKENLQCATTW